MTATQPPEDFCIDNGARFEVGEQWRDHGLCNLKICQPGGFIDHKTCPVLDVPTGCFRMEGNLNVEFPHCCPTAECPWGAGDSMSSSSSSSSSDEEDDLFDDNEDEGGMEVMKGPEPEQKTRNNESDDDNVEVESHFELRNSHRTHAQTREDDKGNENTENTNNKVKVDWRKMCKEDEDNQRNFKSSRDTLENNKIKSDGDSVGHDQNEREKGGGNVITKESLSFTSPAEDVEKIIRNLRSERVQEMFKDSRLDTEKVDYFEGMDGKEISNGVEESEDGIYFSDLGPDLEFESALKKFSTIKGFLDEAIKQNVDYHDPLIEDLEQVQISREEEEKEERLLKLLGPDKKFEKVIENVKYCQAMTRIMEEASENLPREYMPTLHDEMDEMRRFHPEEYEIMYGAGKCEEKYEERSDEKENSHQTISSGGFLYNPEDTSGFLNGTDEEELRKLKIEFNNDLKDISKNTEPSWFLTGEEYLDEGHNEQAIRNEGDTGNEYKHLGDREYSREEIREHTQEVNQETSYQNNVDENCPGHPDTVEGGPLNQVLATEEDDLPYDILDDNEYLEMADTRILPDQVEYLNERHEEGLEETHQDNEQVQSDTSYLGELQPALGAPEEWQSPAAEPEGLFEEDDIDKSDETQQDSSNTSEDTEISQNTNEDSVLY